MSTIWGTHTTQDGGITPIFLGAGGKAINTRVDRTMYTSLFTFRIKEVTSQKERSQYQ